MFTRGIAPFLVAGAGLALSVSGCTANMRGMDAYDKGDYATAFKEFGNAFPDDCDSKYWEGVMYEKGQGTAQDYAQALKWYRAAADCNTDWSQKWVTETDKAHYLDAGRQASDAANRVARLAGQSRTAAPARAALVNPTVPTQLDLQFIDAIEKRDLERVRQFISSGANVNAYLDKGNGWTQTPLFAAVYAGDLTTVKMLTEAGANVDQPTATGTPLAYAALKTELDIADFLVDKGANVNARPTLGEYTPFESMASCVGRGDFTLAVRKACMQLVYKMMDHGALLSVIGHHPIYFPLGNASLSAQNAALGFDSAGSAVVDELLDALICRGATIPANAEDVQIKLTKTADGAVVENIVPDQHWRHETHCGRQ